MNRHEYHEALSSVHASDALLTQVLSLDEKRKPVMSPWNTVRRLAAVAAVLAILLTALLWPASDENYVTGPGLLTIRAYAYETTNEEIIEEAVLEEGVVFSPQARLDPSVSYRREIYFAFSLDKSLYSGKDLTLQVTTDAGIFYNNDPVAPPFSSPSTPDVEQTMLRYYGQHFTVDIDKKLYWEPWGFDYAYWLKQVAQGYRDHESTYKSHLFEKNPSFIDVIIWADDIIVGYCVIEIQEINGITGSMARDFSFEVLTMVSFPKVDGKWQEVTLKYVQEQINNIQTERLSFFDTEVNQ